MRKAGISIVVAAALGVGMLVPAVASGATTIGVSLPAPNGGTNGAGSGTTFVQTVLPGLTNVSPLDGIVVRYQVQFGDWGDVRLRILRPAGGGAFSAVASSATQPIGTTFDELVRIIPTQLPIAQGDQVGIDATFSARLTGVTGADYGYWSPVLAEGDPPSAPTPSPGNNSALAFNADVEPDADRDGFGDETQDLCPTNGAIQGACPTPTPLTQVTIPLTQANRKRCKRKLKKHASAVEAKRKRCKRKKRR